MSPTAPHKFELETTFDFWQALPQIGVQMQEYLSRGYDIWAIHHSTEVTVVPPPVKEKAEVPRLAPYNPEGRCPKCGHQKKTIHWMEDEQRMAVTCDRCGHIRYEGERANDK